MGEEPLVAGFTYYGISPWEVEVAYGYFNSRFKVSQREIEPSDEKFVSYMEIDIPVQFSEGFFKWFEYRRWEKVKALFREMKRRRGSKNALKVVLVFKGMPSVRFIVDVADGHWFGKAVEKIDFVLELVQYHMVPERLPQKAGTVTYRFDSDSARWKMHSVDAQGTQYILKGDDWVRAV